jgi:hypothetical protein
MTLVVPQMAQINAAFSPCYVSRPIFLFLFDLFLQRVAKTDSTPRTAARESIYLVSGRALDCKPAKQAPDR